jgi:hypothetical protein
MAAHANSLSHARYGRVGAWQPKEEDVDVIAPLSQSGEPRDEGSAREGRLEGEAAAIASQFVKTLEHYTAGGKSDTIGLKCREPRGDSVRIDEFGDPQEVLEQPRRHRGLASAVRPTKDDHLPLAIHLFFGEANLVHATTGVAATPRP